jgi:hypothetical protein
MRSLLRCLPLLGLLFAPRGDGSVVRAMSLEELTRAADLVVLGKVTSVRPEWSRDHRRILTRVLVQTTESWKGAPPRSPVAVLTPGGELDGIGQQISGIPEVSTGDRVILFLRQRADAFRLVGMAQGLFRVEPGTVASGEVASRNLGGLSLVPREAPKHEGSEPQPMPVVELRERVATAVRLGVVR